MDIWPSPQSSWHCPPSQSTLQLAVHRTSHVAPSRHVTLELAPTPMLHEPAVHCTLLLSSNDTSHSESLHVALLELCPDSVQVLPAEHEKLHESPHSAAQLPAAAHSKLPLSEALQSHWAPSHEQFFGSAHSHPSPGQVTRAPSPQDTAQSRNPRTKTWRIRVFISGGWFSESTWASRYSRCDAIQPARRTRDEDHGEAAGDQAAGDGFAHRAGRAGDQCRTILRCAPTATGWKPILPGRQPSCRRPSVRDAA